MPASIVFSKNKGGTTLGYLNQTVLWRAVKTGIFRNRELVQLEKWQLYLIGFSN